MQGSPDLLIQSAAAGDRESLGTLITSVRPIVRDATRAVNPSDREDLVQDVNIRLITAIGHHAEAFARGVPYEALVRAAAHRQLVNHYRYNGGQKRSGRRRTPLEVLAGPETERDLDLADEWATAQAAIAKLTVFEQFVIRSIFGVEGRVERSIGEIALEIGVDPRRFGERRGLMARPRAAPSDYAAVYRTLRRGLERLRCEVVNQA